MKRILFVLALVALGGLAPKQAAAQEINGLGLGIILGEPTGLTARFKSGANNFQTHVAWSFSNYAALQVSGDYLRGFTTGGGFPFYAGLGARVKLAESGNDEDTDLRLSARVPVGINHFLDSQPIEFFGEAVPMLNIIPDLDFAFNLAIGGRWYFGR
jgi:hypothetical protein